MTIANKDRPAYPQTFVNRDFRKDFLAGGDHSDVSGLSKREEFAKAALQGLNAGGTGGTSDQRAVTAVADADALLAKLAL